MKLIIDNANIDDIRSMYEYFPMDGVTCNPTILAKEKRPPYEVLKEIRDFIEEGELHVQVLSDRAEGMVEEAYKIRKELGDDTYIKIPTTKEGLKAIRILAAAGIHVTATAIYTQMQAFLAAKSGALYVAPYINRIDNLGSDGVRTAKEIHDMFHNYGFKTEVLAASFKNSRQVITLCEYGIGATTISPDVQMCIRDRGTWSVPKDHPEFGKGFEGAYLEPMTKYNFDRHEAWKEKGQMACICLGIDPGVVNVFAKYAAEYLFDELLEVHVKDGGNLTPPESEKDEIIFGFNVWTVLDEVMNPNAEWSREGGFLIEDAFAGEEDFRMPDPFGVNHLVKVEHEEVVTMPRYLEKYGLQKASFKIALDDNLLNALKVLDKLGLRNIHPVQVGDVKVVPRDVVAACAPQPKDIGEDMTGGMCVGVDCIGIKNGEKKEYFIYQPFDNQEALRDFGLQAVVAQTGFGAALAIELIGREIWKEAGVFSPEYFPSRPYMDLMEEAGLAYQIQER